MQIDQVAIALLGAAAAWLSQARSPGARRWACIFGLLGQPFWFYASWHAGQWGIFTVSVIYLCAWLRGLWVYWLAAREQTQRPGLGTIQLTPGR
ncbi:hypothetical protein C6568_01920 [Melaminivora suipulveris]|uniref:Nicotinamide riboside transporter PnuC n=1 Tax=Melaminivora suipulveris TaxID=2109913 RepID=A0A2R3Q8N0_9BURK|nr:hypothetical protein [Melaminivora suipulveris]AVO48152.1 hypothetical protein C6568_01920 [Melaminivora suipulveris]